MSARENIAKNLVDQLENMTDPAVGKVSRVFFEVQKLAITQFPAILLVTTNESREDISTEEREAVIEYQARCYVRGTEIDTLRKTKVPYHNKNFPQEDVRSRLKWRFNSLVQLRKYFHQQFESIKLLKH